MLQNTSKDIVIFSIYVIVMENHEVNVMPYFTLTQVKY